MIGDSFRIAYRSLKERKVRSILTIVGIFIAIFTVFVLLSLSVGLNETIEEQFRLLGTDKFFVMPKGTLMGMGQTSNVELTLDDVGVIEKVNEIEMVSYYNFASVKIEFKDVVKYYLVIGIPYEDINGWEVFREVYNLDTEDGRALKKGDRKKVVIGSEYKHNNYMGREVKVNDKLLLNDVEYDVVGILESVGNSQDDKQIYMTFEDFKELFDSGDRVDFMMVQIKQGYDVTDVADKTERRLMKAREVDEDTLDFTISTPEQLLESFGMVLNILMAFLIGIGAISILVGGIGIANTMYTSVLERRKEIGTMKAIGAKNSDILSIFIIEAGILGLIGGVLGLLFGVVVAKIIEYIAQLYVGEIIQASMSPIILIGSLAFGFIIGIISGYFPSRQASGLNPVDALRYE